MIQGWVARFMRRNESLIPKIAPPIIATGTSSLSSTTNAKANVSANKILNVSSQNSKNCSVKKERSDSNDAESCGNSLDHSTINEKSGGISKSSSRRKGMPRRLDQLFDIRVFLKGYDFIYFCILYSYNILYKINLENRIPARFEFLTERVMHGAAQKGLDSDSKSLSALPKLSISPPDELCVLLMFISSSI